MQELREHLYQRKIKAYRALYEFTQKACTDCASTDCACKDSICAHVEDQATKVGIKLTRGTHPRLRFIGCAGCTVPPHQRETCTIFLCTPAQNTPGFARLRYQRLKSVAAAIEERLMRLESC